MSRTVSLLGNTLNFMDGGGHFWVYLNWALGLRANGCRVIWIEAKPPGTSADELDGRLHTLRERLRPYGLEGSVVIIDASKSTGEDGHGSGDIDIAGVSSTSDLLLNFAYGVHGSVITRFRRSALVDIDPGLTQLWISSRQMPVVPHDLYFTTGETVGAGGPIPDCGLHWIYTPPCVSLTAWPLTTTPHDAAFTTVSQWYADEWVTTDDGAYANDKRHGFLPFLNLPRLTGQPLELALDIGRGAEADAERRDLESLGWHIRHAYDVAGTPADYQQYIQRSRGEFSAVKPSCVRLQNAWISDRTLCYLASGKPAVVRHTGPSRFLPDRAGLLRFETLEQAASMLEEAAADHERHSRLARALVEEHFDAAIVVRRLLERALP